MLETRLGDLELPTLKKMWMEILEASLKGNVGLIPLLFLLFAWHCKNKKFLNHLASYGT